MPSSKRKHGSVLLLHPPQSPAHYRQDCKNSLVQGKRNQWVRHNSTEFKVAQWCRGKPA